MKTSTSPTCAALPELRGKILGCWCAPKVCHGDVLVELAATRSPNALLASLVEGPEPADSVAYTSAGVVWVGPATEPEAVDDS